MIQPVNKTRRRILNSAITLLFLAALGGWVAARGASNLSSSFPTGYILFAAVVFLALFNVRKRLPFLPQLGSANLWMQAHIYVGLGTFALFAMHIGWQLPTGGLEWFLAALYLTVAGSGLYGLFITRRIPARLAMLREECIYEQIPYRRQQLATEARTLVSAAAEDAESLPRFYLNRLAPFLEQPRTLAYAVVPTTARRRQLQSELDGLDRFLTSGEKAIRKRLLEILHSKDNLDYHQVMQGRLKMWLFVAYRIDVQPVAGCHPARNSGACVCRRSDMSSTHTNASGGNFRASFYIRPDQDKVCQEHAGPSLPETDSSCCPLTNLDRVPVESPSGIPATALAEIQAAAESSGPANPHRAAGATASCRPMPSLRARRRWFTLLCTATTIGLLSASLLVPGGNQFLAPGPLCSQHARLMNSDGVGDCTACHAAGDTSAIAWLGSVFVGNRSLGPTQTELCLKCHDEQLRFGQQLAATPTAPGTPTQPGSQPTHGSSDAVHHSGWPQHPHNLAPEFLQQRTDDRADPTRLNLLASWQAAGSGNADERLACSRCHQEHQGTDHDLAALTDSQCQSCHSQVFGAFEQPASRGGHPEFVSYPQKRRSRIAFDHVTHASQHFPQQQLKFACQQCHLDDARQDAKLLAPFEQACASCHQQPLETSLTKGIELIALPMLDTNALQSAGVDIGQWPAGCDGDFDGRIPELGKLLLLADPQAAQALETLGGPRFEFIDVDPRQPAQLVAVGELVWAMKQLLADLAEDSQNTVRTRLARLSQSNEVSLPIRELASQFDNTSVPPSCRRLAARSSAGACQPAAEFKPPTRTACRQFFGKRCADNRSVSPGDPVNAVAANHTPANPGRSRFAGPQSAEPAGGAIENRFFWPRCVVADSGQV